MNIVFMSMDTLPSTLWARDLYDQMMRQRPGTDSGHPCKHCRHKWECGYLLHQCRKKFRSVLGDTVPPAAGAVRP